MSKYYIISIVCFIPRLARLKAQRPVIVVSDAYGEHASNSGGTQLEDVAFPQMPATPPRPKLAVGHRKV